MVLGLAMVVGSTAWAAGGLDAVRRIASGVLRVLPVFVGVGGVGLLLRAAVPRGRLGGPLMLIGLGTLGLFIELGLLRPARLRGVLPLAVAVGGVLLMASRDKRVVPEQDRVCRLWSWIWRSEYRPTGVAPAKVILRCVLGEIDVDLRKEAFPKGERVVTVDVTLLGGRIDLAVPHGWQVRAGRVELARWVQFCGSVTDARPPSPRDPVQPTLVLNVLGLGGVLAVIPEPPPEPPKSLESRQAQAPPESPPSPSPPRRRARKGSPP